MAGLRKCTICEKHKLPDCFSQNSKRCKPCMVKVSKEWAKKNPEKVKDHQEKRKSNPNYRSKKEGYRIKYRYGISIQERDEMFDSQHGKCAICNLPFESTPHIDHDHATGNIRGLLCDLCNRGLGYFKDEISIFRSALDYLERHKK